MKVESQVVQWQTIEKVTSQLGDHRLVQFSFILCNRLLFMRNYPIVDTYLIATAYWISLLGKSVNYSIIISYKYNGSILSFLFTFPVALTLSLEIFNCFLNINLKTT